MEGVGKIVQGVNTTVDVKPGQTEVEAKKFFGGDGKPKHLGVPGATANQAFNMGMTESVEEDVAGPIAMLKKLGNKMLHGNKPMKMALEMMHKIITKKGTDANHGVNWYADMVTRQFPEGVIDVRALIDAYEQQYGVTERKLSGGEKRSKEAHFKKLKPHKDDFEKRYGKDAESVMHAVATKRAKGQ